MRLEDYPRETERVKLIRHSLLANDFNNIRQTVTVTSRLQRDIGIRDSVSLKQDRNPTTKYETSIATRNTYPET
jgi:hypothetical protein